MTGQSVVAGTSDGKEAGLANAIYKGIENSPVKLTDGRWEGKPYVEGGASRPAAGLVEDFILSDDLNGDGRSESVVLLWQNSGGTGTFGHLAVMVEVDGEWVNLATAPVGDRVQIRSGEISGESIQLDVVQQGEADAGCCPTQLATRSWRLVESGLIEDETIVTGTLSLSVLEGTGWALEDAAATLLFNDGTVSGNSGCNRYSAGIEYGPAPGEISIGPAMGTRMACPEEQMAAEHKFLDSLSRVNTFRFLAGKLALTGERESETFTLKFNRQ